MATPAKKPIPEGFHTVTPYLAVQDAEAMIGFASKVFGATEVMRHAMPDGRIMHAELRIGDSTIMLSEACAQMGPMPSGLYVYVDDVDATYRAAVDAGAASVMEPADMFWGDRFASVRGPAGNMWSIAKHVEDVTPEEIDERAKAFATQGA